MDGTSTGVAQGQQKLVMTSRTLPGSRRSSVSGTTGSSAVLVRKGKAGKAGKGTKAAAAVAEQPGEDKKSKVLERNRAAATRCREKKKKQLQEYDQKATQLKASIGQKQSEISSLRDEISQLRALQAQKQAETGAAVGGGQGAMNSGVDPMQLLQQQPQQQPLQQQQQPRQQLVEKGWGNDMQQQSTMLQQQQMRGRQQQMQLGQQQQQQQPPLDVTADTDGDDGLIALLLGDMNDNGLLDGL